MSATILEALQNANYNIDNVGKMGMALLPIVKSQLNNAVTLLEKGYSIDDEVEPLLDKYGDVENVPDLNRTNPNTMKQKTVNQNHVEIIAKAGNTTENLVKSRLEEYTWVNMFSVKQAYEMLELQAEQLQATVDELKRQLICDVCLGSAMENCACNGTGNILTTLTTIRQINFKLQQRCEELEKYAIHKEDCYKSNVHHDIKSWESLIKVAYNQRTVEKLREKIDDAKNAACTCGLDNLLTPNERK